MLIDTGYPGHLSLLDKDPAHNTSPDMIANLEETAECKGNWARRRSRRTEVHRHERPQQVQQELYVPLIAAHHEDTKGYEDS